ncbi:UNVERIFIED_CONTAM: hypothetical protein O8I53_09635 [Campylobacter lari]
MDGLIQSSGMTPFVILLGLNQPLQTEIQKSFPEMTKFAKALVEGIKTSPLLQGGLPLEKFQEADIKTISGLISHYNHYTFDNATNQIKYMENPVPNVDLQLAITKFIIEYVSTHKKAEIIELANEFSNYVGPVIDRERTIPKGFDSSFVNPYINYPYFGTNNN